MPHETEKRAAVCGHPWSHFSHDGQKWECLTCKYEERIAELELALEDKPPDADAQLLASANRMLCERVEVLEQALSDVLTDLEERANYKLGSDKGVVDIGNGVYYRAKRALGREEA